jgi:dephospho-CoA kinase
VTVAVGLTGGIGSGKSTVASMFADLAVPVLDLDAVGRQLTEPGEPGLQALVACFGREILRGDGTLDRPRLAALCFTDPKQTARLNGVMHPLIREEEQRWLQRQSSPYALIEASVLLESGAASRMDAVVVVLADREERRRRVLARGRQSEALFESIIARQCDDARRRKQADYVLENNGSQEALREQVKALHARLAQRFAI